MGNSRLMMEGSCSSASSGIFIEGIVHVEENNTKEPHRNKHIVYCYPNGFGSLLDAPHQQHGLDNDDINKQQPGKNSMIDPILQERYTQQSRNPIEYQSSPHIMNGFHFDILPEEVGNCNEHIV